MDFLPLKPGKSYLTNTGDKITLETKDKTESNPHLYSPEVCLWFSKKTGIAPSTSMKIVEEIPPDAIQELHAKRDAMMKKLKELGL